MALPSYHPTPQAGGAAQLWRYLVITPRLKQEVLPNCGVACCELDFTRGLRMITDVRLLLAAPTPTGDHRLVVQRQFEQLAGPVSNE